MPTRRPRITITETPEVQHRLDFAAARMPTARTRAELLLALTELGERELVKADHDDSGDDRARAKRFILQYTGAITPEQSEAMISSREADWAHEIY